MTDPSPPLPPRKRRSVADPTSPQHAQPGQQSAPPLHAKQSAPRLHAQQSAPRLPERSHRRHVSTSSTDSLYVLSKQPLPDHYMHTSGQHSNQNPGRSRELMMAHQPEPVPLLPERLHKTHAPNQHEVVNPGTSPALRDLKSQALPRVERGGTDPPSTFREQYQKVRGRADMKTSIHRLAGI